MTKKRRLKKDINSRLYLSSTDKESSYLVVRVYESDEQEVVARVYKESGRWFVWYENANYRFMVDSFSAALKRIEDEF